MESAHQLIMDSFTSNMTKERNYNRMFKKDWQKQKTLHFYSGSPKEHSKKNFGLYFSVVKQLACRSTSFLIYNPATGLSIKFLEVTTQRTKTCVVENECCRFLLPWAILPQPKWKTYLYHPTDGKNSFIYTSPFPKLLFKMFIFSTTKSESLCL